MLILFQPHRRERLDDTTGHHSASFTCLLWAEGQGASCVAAPAVQLGHRSRQRHRAIPGGVILLYTFLLFISYSQKTKSLQ